MSKRAAPLVPLSHEHHKALFVCMGLRRATAETAAEHRGKFLEFWGEHGEPHFQREEEVLFSAFTEHTGLPHPLVTRALADHEEIRALAVALVGNKHPAPDFLNALGERLDAHVRLEERELFPLIERDLPAERLAGLAAALAAGDAADGDGGSASGQPQ